MNDHILNEIKENINSYFEDNDVIDHKINDKDIVGIYKLVEGKKEEAVLYYLISTAFTYHNKITDQDSENGFFVIYGDFFGTLFHKAVIDFEAFELSERIISAYKKMCINAFKRHEIRPAFECLYDLVESNL